MKKMLIALLALAFCWSWSLAAATTGTDWDGSSALAEVDTTGGPDGYGYTWKDSSEPGGPRYRWIDISPAGTVVTGLGDDNYVGPFPIGFTFQFYWYPVTQFWIGSNGYLKFGSGALIASPFPASIPLSAPPNDFISAYMADWVLGSPTAPDSCIRWSNNVDTCIVSWINIQAWQPGGNTGSHSFQVIMARGDSSITVQYGPQDGAIYQSASWQLAGIECVNGQVGLQRAANMVMPASYTVKYYYPDVVTYQAHDLANDQVANATSEGFFLQAGDVFTPWALVKNVGNQNETGYTVAFVIVTQSGTVVYNQTENGGAINAGEEQEVTFPMTWTPTTVGQYFMRATATMTGDINPSNNSRTTECHVVQLPATLLYEDGTPELQLSWQGGGGGDEGAAMRFVPPTYPIRVDCVRVFSTATGQAFIAQVCDDNGPGGIPGTVLSADTLTPTVASWNGFNLIPDNIVINDGAFYVVWLMLGTTASLGNDTTGQHGSRQAWEYTGVWAPYRSGEEGDLLLRAKISEVIPPNDPPEITGYSPTDLDTVYISTMVDFSVTAEDPNGDPLSYLWKLDDAIVGTDPQVQITFDELGAHDVWVWVSDGELADSMYWDVTVIPEGIVEGSGQIPTEYALQAPHPNPFNPTTTIAFSLPKAGDVRLAVFDQTGREIAKLVSGWRPAGTHEVVFDATGLASGIYIVKINTGSFAASQKIVMMK